MGNKVSIVGEEAEVKRFNMFLANDVREWSIHFKSKYPDGKITKLELEKLFMHYFIPTTPEDKQTKTKAVRKFVELLFINLDLRGQNKVCFDDILMGFSTLNKGSFIDKAKWIFRFYDKDKDGFINKEEFMDGYGTLLEMLGMKIDKTFVDEIFTEEKINFQQFEKLCVKYEKNFRRISKHTVYQ